MDDFLIVALVFYVFLMLAVAFFARHRVKNEDDYLVAGRKLNLPITCATLCATWFGAGTLLTATQEIRLHGLKASALEPYGAGFCLIIAGIFFAGPLWKMKLLTIADFFRAKFGQRAEEISILMTCPGFIAWIAVQLMAAAQVLQIIFGLPVSIGIVIVGALAMAYTFIGGMWSVALLDIFQIIIILVGLIAILLEVLAHLGGGTFLAGMKVAIDSSGAVNALSFARKNPAEAFAFLNVFLIAALGNIPGQDFAQRVFSARSAKVASRACVLAGILYISMGTIPVIIGVASRSMLSDDSNGMVIITMAKEFVSPIVSDLFILAIFAAIFSTLNSSILATASPLAHNLLRRYTSKKISSLWLCQIGVIITGISGIIIASIGDHMYALLEAAYSSSMAVLFSPLIIGLFGKRYNEGAIIFAMVVGAILWLLDLFVLDFGFPLAIFAAMLSYLSYYLYLAFAEKEKETN